MNPETIGVIGIAIMLVLMFLGMPIGVTMAMVGVAGLITLTGTEKAFYMFGMTAYRTSATYMLTVLPLFILMGILASYGGLSRDAFNAANKWVGHLPGGLAMATVGGCSAFAAVCGDAIATAATMCTVALPEMRKYNYADQLSLGTIACGGMLGFMIPPSIAFIIYALVTEASIGTLFIAGVLPGLLIAFLFVVAIYIACRLNPTLGPAGPRASWRERGAAFYQVWGTLLLFVLVLGGIYGGIFTPTEGGATGAFGALVIGIAKRQLNWKNFTASLTETAGLTGMILLLIIGAMIFNYFIAVTEIPFSLARFVGGLPLPPILVMSAILVIYIILGFFIDIIPTLMITLPVIYPILSSKGIDPIWFGVLCVLTIMIGMITPPVGVVVYAVGGLVKDVPLFTIFRGDMAIFLCYVRCPHHPGNFPSNLTLVTQYDETGVA